MLIGNPIQRLMDELCSTLEQEPSVLLKKVLGGKKDFTKFLPMLKMMGVDVEKIIVNIVNKLKQAPPEFYDDLKTIIEDFLCGDEEAKEKLLHLIGFYANKN